MYQTFFYDDRPPNPHFLKKNMVRFEHHLK